VDLSGPDAPGYPEALAGLRAQVADAVLAHAEPTVHPDLIRLLAQPGRSLHPEGRCRAGLLALETYGAIRRRYDRAAYVAAAAVELQMQSGIVFDAVADHDAGESGAERLALAIALLTTGMAAASEAASRTPDPSGAMKHFCVSTGVACAGQFLDAVLQRRGDATL
jgi:hypothetical protein